MYENQTSGAHDLGTKDYEFCSCCGTVNLEYYRNYVWKQP